MFLYLHNKTFHEKSQGKKHFIITYPEKLKISLILFTQAKHTQRNKFLSNRKAKNEDKKKAIRGKKALKKTACIQNAYAKIICL